MNVFKCITTLLLLLSSCLAYSGARQHAKIWDTAVVIGSLSADTKVKYYLQPRLVLIDDKYKFENAYMLAGLGYQPIPSAMFFMIGGYQVSRLLNGETRHLDILMQQMNWTILGTSQLTVANVSRLEERRDTTDNQWACRLRELFSLRLPFQAWEGHSLMLWDEVFFNINHPSWINSNTLVEQNRVFVGVGSQLSQSVEVDIGYMNQYLFKKTDDNNNILYTVFNVAL